MKHVLASVLTVLCLGTGAVAEDGPNIAEGKRLAQDNCGRCHNIEADGAFKLYPPSFQAIAVYMDPDVIRMKIMYPEHVSIMPQFHEFMFANHLDNLVGYIASLDQ